MNNTTMKLYRELVMADVKANIIPTNIKQLKRYIVQTMCKAKQIVETNEDSIALCVHYKAYQRVRSASFLMPATLVASLKSGGMLSTEQVAKYIESDVRQITAVYTYDVGAILWLEGEMK